MPNVTALHLVGESLTFFLRNNYPKSLSDQFKAEFKQFTTADILDKTPATSTVAVILYRVAWNEHLRHMRALSCTNGRRALALDLHYLISLWGKSPQEEQILFAWTLLQLHTFPIMDRTFLRGDGGWSATDQIEWIPEDMPHEQMARIWDKLNSPYRLSAAYTARVLQIEPTLDEEQFGPVVARKDIYRGPLEETER